MAEILDIIDDEGDVKDALRSCRDNFLTINKQSLRAGPIILYDSQVRLTQSLTSTTYVDLREFKGAFNTSGGIVLLSFFIWTQLNGINSFFKLIIDDINEYAFAQTGCTAALTTMTPLYRALELNAGNHTFKVQAYVDGGTATIGSTTTASTINIVEIVKG